jgi:arsenite transporter
MFLVSFWMTNWLGADYAQSATLSFTAAGQLRAGDCRCGSGLWPELGEAFVVIGTLIEVSALIGFVNVAFGIRRTTSTNLILV